MNVFYLLDTVHKRRIFLSPCSALILADWGTGPALSITPELNTLWWSRRFGFVCVEVLRPSQPDGVMSSAVSLPNHTFTGQGWSSKRLTSIVHILSP